MPCKQKHRGRHPKDDVLFREEALPALRAAVHDLSWMISRGYAEKAAVKLVGDHYQLTARQRTALQRAACSDAARLRRRRHEAPAEAIAGEALLIDGYNLLITVESALSGGVLIRGRDGCVRDMASLHGSYRKVEETLPAARRIGATLAALAPGAVRWRFDAPVSNSGRLRALLLEESARHAWDWQVELIHRVDQTLAQADAIVISSDSWVLDRAARWTNFAAYLVDRLEPAPPVLDLGA